MSIGEKVKLKAADVVEELDRLERSYKASRRTLRALLAVLLDEEGVLEEEDAKDGNDATSEPADD